MRILLDPAVKEVAAAGGAAVMTASTSAQVSIDKKELAAAPAAATAAPAAQQQQPAKAAASEPEKSAWMKVGDEAKPAADAAAKPAAEEGKKDEKFNLKVPEGHSMEAAALDAFEARMRALGVNQDQAQKLLDDNLKVQKESQDAMTRQLADYDRANLDKLKGRWGTKFGEMSEKLKRVFDFADPSGSFRKEVEAMKMAHAPELVEVFERFIPLFEDPKLRAPSSTGATEKDTRTPQEKLADRYREQLKQPMAAAPVGMKFTK